MRSFSLMNCVVTNIFLKSITDFTSGINAAWQKTFIKRAYRAFFMCFFSLYSAAFTAFICSDLLISKWDNFVSRNGSSFAFFLFFNHNLNLFLPDEGQSLQVGIFWCQMFIVFFYVSNFVCLTISRFKSTNLSVISAAVAKVRIILGLINFFLCYLFPRFSIHQNNVFF